MVNKLVFISMFLLDDPRILIGSRPEEDIIKIHDGNKR